MAFEFRACMSPVVRTGLICSLRPCTSAQIVTFIPERTITEVSSQNCRRAPRGSYGNPLRISDTGWFQGQVIPCPESYKAYYEHIIPEFPIGHLVQIYNRVDRSAMRLCYQEAVSYYSSVIVQSLKKGYTSLLNRPYETINLEERFSGIQHAALALTCRDQFNEDQRFPKM